MQDIYTEIAFILRLLYAMPLSKSLMEGVMDTLGQSVLALATDSTPYSSKYEESWELVLPGGMTAEVSLECYVMDYKRVVIWGDGIEIGLHYMEGVLAVSLNDKRVWQFEV